MNALAGSQIVVLALAAVPQDAEMVRTRTELGALTAEVRAAAAGGEVGLPIVFTLRLTGRAADAVELDAADALGAFDVLAVSAPRRTADAVEYDLTLSTFESGAVAPDALGVRWTDGSGESAGKIEFPTVTVATLLGEKVDPAAFRDIQGEIEIAGPLAWWPWAMAAAGVIAAGAAAWWVFRRRPVVPLTPDAWAATELTRLEREELPAKGEFGRYYDGLTAIVRGYAVRRFAIRAEQQTSREFLDAACTHGDFPAAETDRLRALLRLADLVKFAKTEPTADECAAHLAEARRFVEATRPVVATADNPTQQPGGAR
jgi:hypothetical protein